MPDLPPIRVTLNLVDIEHEPEGLRKQLRACAQEMAQRVAREAEVLVRQGMAQAVPPPEEQSPRWLPLLPATLDPTSVAEAATALGADPAAMIDEAAEDEVWVNDRYQVIVRQAGGGVHLSIRRLDRAACHDWRDLQRIKNQLVGPECEGVELYPAESRLVDEANQTHLWCATDPAYRFPLGFAERAVDDGSQARSRQRPWHPDDRPADCGIAAHKTHHRVVGAAEESSDAQAPV